MVDKQLLEEQYYHGLLPREDINALLRNNGDFLVRSTEPISGQPRSFVLSVMISQEEQIKHFVIQKVNGKYLIERYSFDSIPDMINHHLKRKDSVSNINSKAILRTPILRQSWEILHDEIKLTKKIGEGAYGEVSLGRFTRRTSKQKPIEVAVKLAKLEALTKEKIKEFMNEARLMRNFDHPNVIKIYGVAALQEPLMLVMELASDGALESYLKKHNISREKKLKMCAGASFGLEYLHVVCNVIHRDIAARNCLFGNEQMKISDFGLTREGSSYQPQTVERVPIRWLPPEALKTAIYTQKTDVYAYGILCWEIFSNGAEPYPGMLPSEVGQYVREGNRLTFPDITPSEVSSVILQKCWAELPNKRYSMVEMSDFWESHYNCLRPSTSHSDVPLAKPVNSKHKPKNEVDADTKIQKKDYKKYAQEAITSKERKGHQQAKREPVKLAKEQHQHSSREKGPSNEWKRLNDKKMSKQKKSGKS